MDELGERERMTEGCFLPRLVISLMIPSVVSAEKLRKESIQNVDNPRNPQV